MKKDIEIAREANMLPIEVIASNLGIHKELIETYGKYKAKLPLILIDEKKIKKSRKNTQLESEGAEFLVLGNLMIKGKTTKMTAVFIFMAIVFVISAYPFYAMIINATSTNKEIFSGVPKFLPSTHLVSNFIELNQRILIIRNLMYSIFVSFISTSLQVLICALSGFAFAKFNFKGKNTLFI
jgi:ABC-type glycerol-3-phosphate transport system permease component